MLNGHLEFTTHDFQNTMLEDLQIEAGTAIETHDFIPPLSLAELTKQEFFCEVQTIVI